MINLDSQELLPDSPVRLMALHDELVIQLDQIDYQIRHLAHHINSSPDCPFHISLIRHGKKRRKQPFLYPHWQLRTGKHLRNIGFKLTVEELPADERRIMVKHYFDSLRLSSVRRIRSTQLQEVQKTLIALSVVDEGINIDLKRFCDDNTLAQLGKKDS